MSLIEYAPGKSGRIQMVGSEGRCSTVWSVVAAKHSPDLYITPMMLGGEVKISLHESGSWSVGLTKESPIYVRSAGLRHWETWCRGGELGPGLTRGWYLLIPDEELRPGTLDAKAIQVPDVGPEHAASVEVLIASNEGTPLNFEDAHIIGRWLLAGREESCLIIARRILWREDMRVLAAAAKSQVIAQGEAAGISKASDHRYFIHGHDAQGVRFGLELAAD